MDRVAGKLRVTVAALFALSVLAVIAAMGTGPQAHAQTPPAAAPAPADGSTVILDWKETNWRYFKTWRPPVVIGDAGEGERLTVRDKKITVKEAEQLSPPAPSGYTAADYDDSAWPRDAANRLAEVAFPLEGDIKTTLVILRNKFDVADPATLKALTLNLKYRGGAVVYLNGQEVGRGDLPAGALTPITPATQYPAETYVTEDGKLLPSGGVKPENKEVFDRVAKRDRVLTDLALPVKNLRKGTNVLVIEVHRPDFQAAVNLGFRAKEGLPIWAHCAVLDATLTAQGEGVAPNRSRPAGVQVWNQDRNDRTTVKDWGNPCDALTPVAIPAARNGVFWGKVVVSSDQTMQKVVGTVTDLKQAKGSGVIPAAALGVRYSQPTPIPLEYYHTPWIEPLSAAAPETVAAPKGPGANAAPAPGIGAVQPVWVSVRVPKDAAAGDYEGTLTVLVGGAKAADVPVRVHVADWSIPDPQQFHTFMGIMESSTTLANQYKVAEWTDKHWELMDKALKLLGDLGNKTVEIPVVDQTRLGNPEGMVYWVKKADGTYDYDFTILEKYLAMVKKNMGVPKFVVLHVWHGGGWSVMSAKQVNTVTVVTADGKHEHLQVPEFGTDESFKFWQPVFKGIKERLAKVGMEKSLCLGNFPEGATFTGGKDANAEKAIGKMFDDLAGPDVSWYQITHRMIGNAIEAQHGKLPGGGQVRYHIFTYLPGLPDVDSPDKVPAIYNLTSPRIGYYRRAIGPGQSQIAQRYLGLHALFLRMPGAAYMGLDFWPTVTPDGKKINTMYGVFPRSGSYPGNPEPYFFTWPGPDGIEPMTSYESLREGLQESEALIYLSEAADTKADQLGPDLTARCKKLLLDELCYLNTRSVHKYQYTFFHVNYYGWQDMTGRAFDLAAEVSKKLGK